MKCRMSILLGIALRNHGNILIFLILNVDQIKGNLGLKMFGCNKKKVITKGLFNELLVD